MIGELWALHQTFSLFLNLVVGRDTVWQDISTSSRDDRNHKMSPGQMQPNFVGHTSTLLLPKSQHVFASLLLSCLDVPPSLILGTAARLSWDVWFPVSA